MTAVHVLTLPIVMRCSNPLQRFSAMIKLSVFGVFLALAATTASAGSGSFEAPVSEYLNGLKARQTEVFVSVCRTSTGSAIVVLPFGKKRGMFLEVQHDSVVEAAPLRINGQTVSLDVANAQGGLYTYVVMQHHAEDAMKGLFHLGKVWSLDLLLHIPPGADCPDRLPDYRP